MLFVEVVKTERVIGEAADFFWRALRQRLLKREKILLLLSGGSAVEIYQILTTWLNRKNLESGLVKNLTVGLVDERYGPVGHPDSNEEQIRQTGFYEAITQNGGKVLPVLTGKDPGEEAARYERLIRQGMEEADEILAAAGVGPDGHTAGIFPQKSQDEFAKIFPSDR